MGMRDGARRQGVLTTEGDGDRDARQQPTRELYQETRDVTCASSHACVVRMCIPVIFHAMRDGPA
jgi:hypothetical protein